MANRLDFEMLQNQLNNMGNDALKRRQMQQQHEAEMQRIILEQQMRDIQQSRYDAQTAHYQTMEQSNTDRANAAQDKASQGTIKAYIANPDDPTKGVMFDGPTDTFNANVQVATSKYGKPPLIFPGPQEAGNSNKLYATHEINGSKYYLYDKQSNDALVSTMEKNGYMTNGVAPPKPTPSDTDEQTTVQTIPAQDEKPASPGVHHWFSADEPPTPGSPAVPATTITTKRRVPATGIQPPTATPPALPAAVPTAPGALPTSAPLVPTGAGLPLPPQTPSAGPTKVNTQADYDALPPGTPYVDSQGNSAVKGGKPNSSQQ